MGLVVKNYTFSAGATIIAAEHNSNFDTLYNEFNGNIDNNNIKLNATIADSKLAQINSAAKVTGTALYGLATVPSGARVLPSANVPVGTTNATGGTGSAGAGKQYVSIIINGNNYKILHDGVI